MDFKEILQLVVIGVAIGSAYAIAASGLVVTYTTSGIFNFAHGAIGMLSSFLYWQLTVQNGWPVWIAVIFVVVVFGPAVGALIEWGIVRGLRGSSLATRIVVTIALMVFAMGLATNIWEGQSASLPGFFPNADPVRFLDVALSVHQVIVIFSALAVALCLRFFLFGTRIGTAMRAVVDSPATASLNGIRPDVVSQLSWAIGAGLAALAGVLIGPMLQLEAFALTFLVINAYAAAVVGRLKSLPMTFVGAVGLGLFINLVPYVVEHIGFLSSALEGWRYQPALPAVFLFIVLMLIKDSSLRGARPNRARTMRVPTLMESVLASAAVILFTIVVAQFLSNDTLNRLQLGLAIGVVGLSLVVFTGYGGQVSLGQMGFAGVGAFAMLKVGGDSGNPLGLLAAFALAAPVGALVAIPALRVRGLYLALTTMAFAQFMDETVFRHEDVFGSTSNALGRLSIFGMSTDGDKTYLVTVVVVLCLLAIGVLALRRSRYGRILTGMRDSELASATLGVDPRAVKLVTFALSAGIAGVGGALMAMANEGAAAEQFALVQSLPVLLIVVVGGVGMVTSAFSGGLALGLMSVVGKQVDISNLELLLTGVAAVGLSRSPEGWGVGLADQVTRIVPTSRRFAFLPGRPAAKEEPVAEVTPADVTRPAGVRAGGLV